MPIATAVTERDVEAAEARLGLGGNSPPLEERIAMEFREALLTDHASFIDDMEARISAVDRAQATDDETLGKCGTLAKMLRAVADHINVTHKTVKDPYLQGGRAVDAEKNRLIGRVSDAQAKLQDKMNAFMAEREAQRRAEQARRDREAREAAEAAAKAEREAREAEEAAQRAAAEATSDAEREEAAARAAAAAEEAQARMAEAALAAAPAAKSEPVRSDEGATISGRTVWNSAVDDYQKAFKHVRSDPKVKEAIDAAIQRLVKAGQRELAGCRVWPTTQAVAR